MKHFILIILAVVTLGISSNAGWFNNDGEQAERDRRVHAEQQLARQQRTNGGLEIAVLMLAVGCVSALIIGAAVGGATRRAAKQP